MGDLAHDSGIPSVKNREADLDEKGYPTKITLEVGVPDGASFQRYVVTFKVSVDGDDETATFHKIERKAGSQHQHHWVDKSLAALFRAQRAVERMGIEVVSLHEVATQAEAQAYEGNDLVCQECEERFDGAFLEEESAGKSATDWCPCCGASASEVVPVYQYEHQQQA